MKKIILLLIIFSMISCSKSKGAGSNKKEDLVIKELSEVILVGVSDEVTQDTMDKFPKIWMDFMPRSKEIKNISKPGEFWGLSYNMKLTKDGFSMRYLAASEVKNEDEQVKDFTKYKVPKATYAVFTHKGKLDSLKDTYNKIHKTIIPKSKYKQVNNYEIEFYNHEYKHNSDESTMYIYVPVKLK